MERIVISGGSGLVGKHLSTYLCAKGYEVVWLSRNPQSNSGIREFYWNYEKGEIDTAAFTNASALIHLAGASIGEGRWTAQRKQLIRASRVQSGEFLAKTVKALRTTTCKGLNTYITASGIGYYGAISSEHIYTEDDAAAGDFLGETCKAWESVCDSFQALGIRTAQVRTGLVLSKRGGALEKLCQPVRIALGSAIGTGRQYLPWIHLDDLCQIYGYLLANTHLQGAFNAVAPLSPTNRNFMQTLATTMHRPFWNITVPAFVLRAMLGEQAVIVLEGSRVAAEKLISSGFVFQYPELSGALEALLK